MSLQNWSIEHIGTLKQRETLGEFTVQRDNQDVSESDKRKAPGSDGGAEDDARTQSNIPHPAQNLASSLQASHLLLGIHWRTTHRQRCVRGGGCTKYGSTKEEPAIPKLGVCQRRHCELPRERSPHNHDGADARPDFGDREAHWVARNGEGHKRGRVAFQLLRPDAQLEGFFGGAAHSALAGVETVLHPFTCNAGGRYKVVVVV
jgi:hypothetical protein